MAITEAVRSCAIPYTVSKSPLIKGDHSPDVVTAGLDVVLREFSDEGAGLGETNLDENTRIMGVHNGMPYLTGKGTLHYMSVFLHKDHIIHNPSEVPITALAQAVHLSRNFLLHEGDSTRRVGFQVNPRSGHNNPVEKGRMAQTLEPMHWHNIQFNRDDLIINNQQIPPDKKDEFESMAKIKSHEPYAKLTELLLRRVYQDAKGRSHLNDKLSLVQNPDYVTNGAISFGTDELSDREIAIVMQGMHDSYTSTFDEVASLFIRNSNAEVSVPRLLRNPTERTMLVARYLDKLERLDIYSDQELGYIQNRLLHLAKHARSEEEILQTERPKSSDIRTNAQLVPWRVPSYAVFISNEGGEKITFRATPFSNAGFMEASGLAPIRLKDTVIDSNQYRSDHQEALRSFNTLDDAAAIIGPVYQRAG
ncbi:MAG: hypothetical protein U0525_02020 [Patescibacteria group bacterium]